MILVSPNGGEITLTLKNEQNHLIVSVRDYGLGIPDEALEKLFNKFQRIDQSDRKKIVGTGLGLAISREIVERHEGEMWVESKEGEGSTFYFSIPLDSDNTIDKGTVIKGSPEVPLKNGETVMIIEDDTSLALLLSEELKASGFRVLHHYDPKNAYTDILKQPLAAVVVDLMLGDDMDGWELIKQLKENEDTVQLPIIISSALDKSVEKVERFQVNEYLTKPYPPKDLSKTLLNFIQSKEGKDGEILFPEEE
ncbi:hybrid sensor histidine kinase/response regulator [Salipaludibacillus sp. CF4.18]|uniref:hybrid sensor histidine kinase/response regulator n=1 Tax=Salipaludibacillus sp. CF4.18 TaxID=3373081 RepID=UPI003EE7FF83